MNNETARTSLTSKLNTPMSYIYDAVSDNENRAPKLKIKSYLEIFDLPPEQYDQNDYRRELKILELVEVAAKEINNLHYAARKKSRSYKVRAREKANEVFDKCFAEVEKRLLNDHVYHYLLRELDYGYSSRHRVSSYHALLFAMICMANDCYLLNKFKNNAGEMCYLVHDESAAGLPEEQAVNIFGHPHRICKGKEELNLRRKKK
jgi:hypothetical protein